MNRVALGIVLAIAVVVGVVFAVYPGLDTDISKQFLDSLKQFPIGGRLWEQHARAAARWVITLVALPSFLAIAGKLILPERRMLVSGSAALFIVATLAIGPGLVTLTLKDNWHRARPIDVMSFSGTDRFTAWWDPTGPCLTNCSFIAGEPSGAFWTVAAAAVTPPQWRALAYGAAIAFGVAVGSLRIAAGGHYFTDVVFAGVFMYLVAWVLHGLIFRWRATRLNKDTVERVLAWAGQKIRGAVPARPSGQNPEDGS